VAARLAARVRPAVQGRAGLDRRHPPGQRRQGKPPFGPPRTCCSCLALAVLERADAQITLGRLAEGVLAAAGEPELVTAGVSFTSPGGRTSDLVAAGAAAARLGACSTGSPVTRTPSWGTTATCCTTCGAGCSPRADRRPGPSTIAAGDFPDRLAELTTSRSRHRRVAQRATAHRLTRRLLDDPVVYYDELAEDERGYLVGQRHAITRRIEDATGLVTEMRAEGIAMVDPDERADRRADAGAAH